MIAFDLMTISTFRTNGSIINVNGSSVISCTMWNNIPHILCNHILGNILLYLNIEQLFGAVCLFTQRSTKTKGKGFGIGNYDISKYQCPI